MNFFLDNNLSPKLAKCLHVLVQPEHAVVHLKERFAANTPDEVWMRTLAAEENWAIISMDVRIAGNPHEIAAWREAGHTAFFLRKGWTRLGFWEQAWKLVKCFPEVLSVAQGSRRQSIYYVTVQGKIEG